MAKMGKMNKQNYRHIKIRYYMPLIILMAILNNPHYSEAKEKKPNIVFILIDDLGWQDLQCYGSNFYETPNIDKLRSEGMMFTYPSGELHLF